MFDVLKCSGTVTSTPTTKVRYLFTRRNNQTYQELLDEVNASGVSKYNIDTIIPRPTWGNGQVDCMGYPTSTAAVANGWNIETIFGSDFWIADSAQNIRSCKTGNVSVNITGGYGDLCMPIGSYSTLTFDIKLTNYTSVAKPNVYLNLRWLGASWAYIGPTTPFNYGTVADGAWHTVTLRFPTYTMKRKTQVVPFFTMNLTQDVLVNSPEMAIKNVSTATYSSTDVLLDYEDFLPKANPKAKDNYINDIHRPSVLINNVIYNKTTLKKYEKFEALVDITGNYDNAFDPDSIKIEGIFKLPDNTVVTIPGFYDPPMVQVDTFDDGTLIYSYPNERIFKIRFAAKIPGTYYVSVKATQANGSISKTTTQTKLTVTTESDGDGYIRRGLVNPHYFETSEGKSMFFNGVNMGARYSVPLGTARWTQYNCNDVDRAIDHGYNLFRLQSLEQTLPQQLPMKILTDRTNPSRFCLDACIQLDNLLEYFKENNAYLDLVLLQGCGFQADLCWANSSWNIANNPDGFKYPQTFYNQNRQNVNLDTYEFDKAEYFRKTVKNVIYYIYARYGYSTNLGIVETYNEIDMIKGNLKARYNDAVSENNPAILPNLKNLSDVGTLDAVVDDIKQYNISIINYWRKLDTYWNHLLTCSVSGGSYTQNVRDYDLATTDLDVIQPHRYVHGVDYSMDIYQQYFSRYQNLGIGHKIFNDNPIYLGEDDIRYEMYFKYHPTQAVIDYRKMSTERIYTGLLAGASAITPYYYDRAYYCGMDLYSLQTNMKNIISDIEFSKQNFVYVTNENTINPNKNYIISLKYPTGYVNTNTNLILFAYNQSKGQQDVQVNVSPSGYIMNYDSKWDYWADEKCISLFSEHPVVTFNLSTPTLPNTKLYLTNSGSSTDGAYNSITTVKITNSAGVTIYNRSDISAPYLIGTPITGGNRLDQKRHFTVIDIPAGLTNFTVNIACWSPLGTLVLTNQSFSTPNPTLRVYGMIGEKDSLFWLQNKRNQYMYRAEAKNLAQFWHTDTNGIALAQHGQPADLTTLGETFPLHPPTVLEVNMGGNSNYLIRLYDTNTGMIINESTQSTVSGKLTINIPAIDENLLVKTTKIVS